MESYTLDELLREVQRRSEHCVLCVVPNHIESEIVPDEVASDDYVFAYNGDPFFCIGLVAHAQHVMNADLKDESDGHFTDDDDSDYLPPFGNN